MARAQKIKIKVKDPKYTPIKAHENDACYDLVARLDHEIDIVPGEITTVDTGVSLELPDDWEALIRPRSGLASKVGLTVANSPGTIDSGYRGEIKVVLSLPKLIKRNQSFMYPAKNEQSVIIKDGMRIAQIAFRRVPKTSIEIVPELVESERGDNGLGSTGV
tara:strand:- start:16273 stop:16758 length:486 start_codon:yes stop_codon:yes gene_type:complete